MRRRAISFKTQEISGQLSETLVKQKVAEKAARSVCCSKQCLHTLLDEGRPYDYSNSTELVLECRRQVEGLTTDQRYALLSQKFEASLVHQDVAVEEDKSVSFLSQNCSDNSSKRFNEAVNAMSSQSRKRRRLEHKFTLKTFNHKTVTVCRFAWCNAYGISHKILDTLSRAYKHNEMEIDSDVISDRGRPGLSFQEMEKLSKSHGLNLSFQHIQASIMPKSQEAFMAYIWLNMYFNQYGDHAPNKAGQIHLDPIEKKEIWEEYVRDVRDWYPDSKHYSYQKLVELWALLFPHVSIREYKAVTGKCNCCALISGYRWSYRDHLRRKLLKDLHAFHRGTFMKERMTYYERRLEAIQNPDTIMSLIVDGMSQNHNVMPWMANQKEFAEPLPQHIQGVIEHGRRLVMYRTFHNLMSNSNLIIYVVLAHLERWYQEKGRFPDKIFLQIDGGSENANKFLLAINEILVAIGICSTIIITRLPVGHTHEDIDSKFALIWVGFRTSSVWTPDAYARKLREIFKAEKEKSVEVIDLWVVPDFMSWLAECIDDQFSRWTKEESTQHQWKFERVPRSEHFPLGVRVWYRAYASDEVVEIVEASTGAVTEFARKLGLEARVVYISWYPTDQKHRPDGMYLVQKLPQGLPKAAPFVVGGRVLLDKTLACVDKTFTSSPETVKAWRTWAQIHAPEDDSAEAYVARLRSKGNDLHIPLREFFMSMQQSASNLSQASNSLALKAGASTSSKDRLPIYRSGQSVSYSANPHPEEPRVLIDTRITAAAQERASRYAAQQINYTKKSFTNAKLELLCRKRCIRHTGNKADLIKRLQDWNSKELFERFDIVISEVELDYIAEKLKQARADLDKASRDQHQFAVLNGIPIVSKSLVKIAAENAGTDGWLNDEVVNYMCEVFQLRADHMAAVALSTQLAASRKTKDGESSAANGVVGKDSREGICNASLCARTSTVEASISSSTSFATDGVLVGGGTTGGTLIGADTCTSVIVSTDAGDNMLHTSVKKISDAGLVLDLVEDDDPDRGSSKTFFMNSFFFERLLETDKTFTYDNVKRWTKKVDIFSMTQIFIPVNIDNCHWALIRVLMSDKVIEYYDSLGYDGSKYLEASLQFLKCHALPAKHGLHQHKGFDGVFKEKEWTLRDMKCLIPQQDNGLDCGVFVIVYMDLLAMDLPFMFGKDDMQHSRRRLLLNILDVRRDGVEL